MSFVTSPSYISSTSHTLPSHIDSSSCHSTTFGYKQLTVQSTAPEIVTVIEYK